MKDPAGNGGIFLGGNLAAGSIHFDYLMVNGSSSLVCGLIFIHLPF